MKPIAIAALTALGLALAPTVTASAADLDYRYIPKERYGGTAYEDPRYADIYGQPAPRHYEPQRHYEPPRYAERVPIPHEPVYRDPRYAEVVPPAYGHHGRCVPRETIRYRLESEGWTNFHGAETRGETAFVKARRGDGRSFGLQIDRCSGEIVDARPLSNGHGNYAGAPRRYDPYY